MDAGGSCHSCNYRLQNRTEKRNKRKRGLDNEQRYFYGTDGKERIQGSPQYSGCDEHRGHCVPAGGA